MPVIYEYFGVNLHFYCNERMLCINGESGGSGGTFGRYESRAEFQVRDGRIVQADIYRSPLREPLPHDMMEKFKKVIGAYSPEIYQKWSDFFLRHKLLERETFPKKIRTDPLIPIYDHTYKPSDFPMYAISVERVYGYGYYCFDFYFSDGYSSRVDFEPFFQASKHPEIKRYLEDTRLWDFETDLMRCGILGWFGNVISFSLLDLYENNLF